MDPKVKRTAKFVLFLVILVAGVSALLRAPDLSDIFAPGGMDRLQDRVIGAVRSAGPLAPALFVVVFSISAIALPGIPFVAAGAILFGPVWGSLLSIVSAHIAAATSFLLGRYLLRDYAASLLRGKLEELDRKGEIHGFRVVLLLRILSFPFAVVNYGVSATRIRFRDFLLGTLVGMSPYLVIISFFFGSFQGAIASRELSSLRGPGFLVPAGILGIAIVVATVLRRFRKGIMGRGEASDADVENSK